MAHKGRSGAKKLQKHTLTDKQERLVQAVLDPSVKTLAEAGEQAGYHDRQGAFHALQSATVQNALQAALEKAGFDEKLSARILRDAADAEKTVSVEDHGEAAAPGSRVPVTEPDHNIRLKANEQFLKIKKYIGNGHDNGNGKQEQHLHFHFGDTNTNELLGEIKNQLTTLGEGKPTVPGRSADSVRDGSQKT